MITIGNIYDGNDQNLFDKWMTSICDDISFLPQKPELIIVNKSKNQLITSSYSNYFSKIKIIEIEKFYNPTLLECYYNIIRSSSYKIIHFRDKNIIPPKNLLEKMYNVLISDDVDAIRGLYDDVLQSNYDTSKLNNLQYCNIDFIIFKKNNVSLTNKITNKDEIFLTKCEINIILNTEYNIKNNDIILKDLNINYSQDHKNNKKNSIAICIPFYKRHEITDFVFNYYHRLQEELKYFIDIIVITAGSEFEISRKLAEKYNFVYIEVSNNPLSQKDNALYLKAKEYNVDACLKIDSDNIISKEFFYFYNNLIKEGYDYAGILDCYFVVKDNVIYFKGYDSKRLNEPVGTGRFLSKNLLEKLDWKPWGNIEINNILDKNLTNILKKFNIKTKVIKCEDINGYNIDIKSNAQLTDLNCFISDKIEHVNLYDTFNKLFNIEKIKNVLFEYDIDKLSKIKHTIYDKKFLQETTLFSIVIPTQWNLKNINDFEYFLNTIDKSKYVGEIILIDNDNKNIKIDLSKYKKIKHIINNENIFVNPSWNLGYSLHNYEYKLILANDDLKIKDNIDIIFELLNKTEFEIVGLGYNENIKNSNIEYIEKFPRSSYGSFLYVKNYKYIPEQLKIWSGDNLQFNSVSSEKRGILKTNLIQNTEKRIIQNKSNYSLALIDNYLYNNMISSNGKLNVIIRTSNRPNYFKNCIDSIKKLYMPNEIKFHITIDEYKDLCYVQQNLMGYDYNFYFIDKEKIENICKNINITKPQRTPNYYFNVVRPFLNGWCFFLDDDDVTLNKIDIKNLKYGNIYIYKTKINNKIIPSNKNFNNNIVINDISGLCIVFHSDIMIDWTPQNGGDYFFISELYKKYNCIWIDEILSHPQKSLNQGKRNDI